MFMGPLCPHQMLQVRVVPETEPETLSTIRQKPAEIRPAVPDSLKIIFIQKITNQQLIRNT